jgi:hypothetical protein
VPYLATFRTRYGIEQFRRVLQPIAHNIALEAVQKLNGLVRIKAYDGNLISVESNDFAIHFSKRSIAYWDFKRKLMLQIEEHPYTDGNMTKIVVQGDAKVKEKAENFIADLMKGIKPDSLFSLKNYVKNRSGKHEKGVS